MVVFSGLGHLGEFDFQDLDILLMLFFMIGTYC